MSRLRFFGVTLALLALASCEEAPLTAPTGSTMFLQANPLFVIANGGISVVTAVLTEPAGTFVPDGTEVFFFTTLGRIDDVGKTVRGVARVNFVSDSRSGRASVTAISGSVVSGTPVEIAIGSALPTRVLLDCDPRAITTQRSCRLTATVLDENGNFVQNVPLTFSLDAEAVEESLDSRGAVQYTNSNGQAFDTLRTRAPFGLDDFLTVTVTVTTANGITATLSVNIATTV
jgi:hypothetical protein